MALQDTANLYHDITHIMATSTILLTRAQSRTMETTEFQLDPDREISWALERLPELVPLRVLARALA